MQICSAEKKRRRQLAREVGRIRGWDWFPMAPAAWIFQPYLDFLDSNSTPPFPPPSLHLPGTPSLNSEGIWFVASHLCGVEHRENVEQWLIIFLLPCWIPSFYFDRPNLPHRYGEDAWSSIAGLRDSLNISAAHECFPHASQIFPFFIIITSSFIQL